MRFPRQEYWSGLPLPSPGDPLNTQKEPETFASSALQVDSLPLNHQGSLAIDPHKYNQLIFDKEASEEIQCRKNSLSIMMLQQLDIHMQNKMRASRNRLRLSQKINSKVIIDLNIKCNTNNFQRNIGEKLCDLGFAMRFYFIFLRMTPLLYFISLYNLFFGRAGSFFRCVGFSLGHWTGATLCCGPWASHCSGFSCCRAWTLGTQPSVVVVPRL